MPSIAPRPRYARSVGIVTAGSKTNTAEQTEQLFRDNDVRRPERLTQAIGCAAAATQSLPPGGLPALPPHLLYPTTSSDGHRYGAPPGWRRSEQPCAADREALAGCRWTGSEQRGCVGDREGMSPWGGYERNQGPPPIASAARMLQHHRCPGSYSQDAACVPTRLHSVVDERDAQDSGHFQQQHLTNEWQAGNYVPSLLNPNASTFQPAEVQTLLPLPLESVYAAKGSHMDHVNKWHRNCEERAKVSVKDFDRGSSNLTSADNHVSELFPEKDSQVPATEYKEPVPGKPPKPRTRRQKKTQAPKATAPVSEKAELTLPIRTLPATSKSPQPPKQERLMLIEPPQPSQTYLSKANELPSTLAQPRPLLVVLDLNGTLLHREQRGGSSFVARPHVREFLHYLLAHHKVLVWSSARPVNVDRMCHQLFSRAQREKLIGVWSRNDLRLRKEHYNQKVQVYKQLSWVWDSDTIASSCVGGQDAWSQQNTVLIDDSTEKAASEPLNLIRIDEFEGKGDQRQADVLGQVARYLETLSSQADVSAYIRTTPFVYDSEAEAYNWTEPPIADVHYDIREGGSHVSG